MENRILIITDYDNGFWQTYDNWVTPRSLDVSALVQYFTSSGFAVSLSSYQTMDFSRDYRDYFVLYGSSEDLYGGTKDYIEDVLVWLWKTGAILVPSFEYFREHHNKAMMEILRNTFPEESMRTLQGRTFRALSDLQNEIFEYPLVLKSSSGAGSTSVYLIHDEAELHKVAERVSRIPSEKKYWYLRFAKLKRKILGKDEKYQINNKKFIIQKYIPGLTGDYKILVFWDHYFVLHRLNRQNDFRASGSGNFCEPDPSEITHVLNYAKLCFEQLKVPQASLDIVYDGNLAHLVEFQCISFGFKAMSMTEYHYEYAHGEWVRVEGRVHSESEYAHSVVEYIRSYCINE